MIRKIFRNIYLLPLFLLIITQACKSETPRQKAESVKTPQPVEKYCYIKDIRQKKQGVYAYVDFIEYLKTSDLKPNADRSKIIELPNGFCFLNSDIKYQDFVIVGSAEVIMQTFSFNNEGNFNFNQKVKLDELVEGFAKPDAERLKFSPFKISLNGNEILSLKEIYIP